MNARRTLAALLLAAPLLLASCGGDELPSRAEFVAEVKKSMGEDVSSSLESAGIKAAEAETIMTDFIGCIYDEIKDDEETLRQAYEQGGDSSIESQIEKKAAPCTKDLTEAVTNAAMAGAGGAELPTDG